MEKRLQFSVFLLLSSSTAAAVKTAAPLPIRFEPNRGQTASGSEYLTRAGACQVGLTAGRAEFTLASGAVIRMTPLGGSNPRASASDLLPGVSSYYSGSDRSRWISAVPTFGRVTYTSVYPGIDLTYYGNQGSLEFDFVVAPGASPNRIRMGFEGARRMTIDASGNVAIQAGSDVLSLHRPRAYQLRAGRVVEITAGFVQHQASVGFALGPYDRRLPLYIDPVIAWVNTALPGVAISTAVDQSNNVYVLGRTLPDARHYVAKLDPAGTQVLFTTYLSPDGAGLGGAIAVSDSGVLVAGQTSSSQFGILRPLPGGAALKGPSDGFVAALTPGGTLSWSTYLGGSADDAIAALTLDSVGNVFVAGSTNSTDFPSAAVPGGGSLPAVRNAFVSKISPGPALAFTTVFGGSGDDSASSVALDDKGNLYIAGTTSSADFLTTAGVLQPKLGGLYDAFLSKLNPAATTVLASTFLGGDGDDSAVAVEFDSASVPPQVWLAGNTGSTHFPVPGYTFDFYNHSFVARVSPALDSILGGALPRFSGVPGQPQGFSLTHMALDRQGPVTSAIVLAAQDSAPSPACILYGWRSALIATRLFPSGDMFALSLVGDGPCFGGATGGGIAAARDGSHNYFAAGNAAKVISVRSTYSTVTSSPTGMNVQVDGTNYVTPISFDWAAGSEHVISYLTTLATSPSATCGPGCPDLRYRFWLWADQSTTATRTVTAAGNDTFWAQYYAPDVKLSLVASPAAGGTFITGPSSPDGFFESFTAFIGVRIRAVPNPGYTFDSWSGCVNSTANPVLVNGPQPSRCQANFVTTAGLTAATVTSSPPGVPLVVDGQDVATPRTFYWPAGSAHNLFARQSVFKLGSWSYLFSGWGGGAGASQTITVPSTPVTYTAAYSRSDGVTYSPLGPCRILDTRIQGQRLQAKRPRNIDVSSSACGIPAGAKAYSLTATAVPLTSLSYLAICTHAPLWTDCPTSVLNAPRGNIVANATIVGAAADGSIDVISSDDTHFVLDINGVFTADPGGSLFFPVTPCRAADTRAGNGFAGSFGPPSFAPVTSSRDFPLGSSNCGVPASASAYALDFTLVPAAPVPFLTAWPTGSSRPLASNANSSDGAITSAGAIVPAANGSISAFLYTTGQTDLLIDVFGYFRAAAGGSRFYPVDPCRVVDTRISGDQFGPLGPPALTSAKPARTIPVPVVPCGVPAGATAYALNLTVVPGGPLWYLQAYPSGTTPTTSVLNSPDGRIVANAAIVQAGTGGGIDVYAALPAGTATDLVIDVTGYFAP